MKDLREISSSHLYLQNSYYRYYLVALISLTATHTIGESAEVKPCAKCQPPFLCKSFKSYIMKRRGGVIITVSSNLVNDMMHNLMQYCKVHLLFKC